MADDPLVDAVDEESERPSIGQLIAGVRQPSYMPRPTTAPAATPAPDVRPQIDPSALPESIRPRQLKPEEVPSAPTGVNNPNLAALAKQQAALSTPIDPYNRNAEGKIASTKPEYRMGTGQRILGTLSNALSGFSGRGGEPTYVGPGATNWRFGREEAARQGQLEGVNTQIKTQEAMDRSNEQLMRDAQKGAYEGLLGEARKATAESQQSRAETAGQLADATAKLKEAQANRIETGPAEQRAADADKYGLKGQARTDYILTGKLPKDMMGSNRQPTELEEWKAAFKRDNGRDPTADEIAQRRSKGRMSQDVEDKRNDAWRKARREYDAALQKIEDPNDPKALAALQQEYYDKRQEAQDEYESGVRRVGGTADHVELPRNHFGEGGSPQPAPRQPATQPARQPKPAPAAKAPAKPTEAAPAGRVWVYDKATGKRGTIPQNQLKQATQGANARYGTW